MSTSSHAGIDRPKREGDVNTVATPNLTLYAIQTELIELMEYREEVAGEVRVTEADKQEQAEALKAIDQSIAEYVKREVTKVDNTVGFLRECQARQKALKEEEQRIAALRKRWEDREERVKKYVAEVLAIQLLPETIVEAKQNQVLRRLNGRVNELKLCKSPASVEVTDESLLPDELVTITATMPLSEWRDVEVVLPEGTACTFQADPDKRAIAAELKRGEPVPGARLINDNVHLRIS